MQNNVKFFKYCFISLENWILSSIYLTLFQNKNQFKKLLYLWIHLYKNMGYCKNYAVVYEEKMMNLK